MKNKHLCYRSNRNPLPISLDTEIKDFLQVPELSTKVKSRSKRINRIKSNLNYGLSSEIIQSYGYNLKTLKDLKTFVEENGWIKTFISGSRANFPRIVEPSINYFNKILKNYGIEPFNPIYKSYYPITNKKNISLKMELEKFLYIPELSPATNRKCSRKDAFIKGILRDDIRVLADLYNLENLGDLINLVEKKGWHVRYTGKTEHDFIEDLVKSMICYVKDEKGNIVNLSDYLKRFQCYHKSCIRYLNKVLKKYGLGYIHSI